MQDVNPHYNYTVEQDGEFTRFIYKKTPISYKMAFPLCWYTAIPAFCLTMLTSPPALQGGVVKWLLFMAGLSCLIVFIINLLRRPGTISISKTAIVANNKTYQLDHVASFLIQDPAGMYSTHTTIVVHGGSKAAALGQGMGQMANESRMAIQQHIRNAGYKIVIRYGAKDIKIARGLGETEAEVLFDKITAVAGYSLK